MMKELFFKRRKGESQHSPLLIADQLLAVYTDGKQYRLHYQILDRTDPTRAEREAGEKAKRIERLNEEYFIDCGAFIRASDYPLPKLTRDFIKFLKEQEEHGTES